MKLFLDDNRIPYDVFTKTIDPIYEKNENWIIVRDYYQFINFIQRSGTPKLISFDHDLSQEHYLSENQINIDYKSMRIPTGFHAAEWLIKYCKENNLKLPEIRVHSENMVGKLNIQRLFL